MSKVQNVIAKDTSVIPSGMYCYRQIQNTSTPSDPRTEENDFPRGQDIELCPYWESRSDKPYQENGYCNFLGMGDWHRDSVSLLWDQVKECEINTEDTQM